MTGKFTDKNNSNLTIILVVTFLGWIILGMLISAWNNFLGVGFAIISALACCAVMYAEIKLLSKGSFSVYKDKVVFQVGLIKYIFRYSEITSAETQTGFTHGRYGKSPHIKLTITLKSGDTVTFRDDSVPDDALITPEKHKEFLDNHQFTKLSNYINKRAGR